jgi:hypothetical protein
MSRRSGISDAAEEATVRGDVAAVRGMLTTPRECEIPLAMAGIMRAFEDAAGHPPTLLHRALPILAAAPLGHCGVRLLACACMHASAGGALEVMEALFTAVAAECRHAPMLGGVLTDALCVALARGHAAIVAYCLQLDGEVARARLPPSDREYHAGMAAGILAGHTTAVAALLADKRMDGVIDTGDVLVFAVRSEDVAMLRLVWSHPRTTDAHRYRALNEAAAYPGMLREALRPGMFMDTLPLIPPRMLSVAAYASKADAVDMLLCDPRLHISVDAGAMAVDCALLNGDVATLRVLLDDQRIAPERCMRRTFASAPTAACSTLAVSVLRWRRRMRWLALCHPR